MTTEESLVFVRSAYAMLGQFLEGVDVQECDHPEALSENLPSNGKDDQHFRCGQCGKDYIRPWPEG